MIQVTARCANGKCESVELTNVPCFPAELDAPLEVEGMGTLTVDVAFGGMWYAIADARALGFALEPEEAADLSRAGEAIRLAAREQLPCVHPANPALAGVSIVQIAEPWRGLGEVSKNAVVIAPGRLDRSPTGTGLSARMATLHARGLMRTGDGMSHASVLGTTFEGRIVSETTVGDRPAIVPAIRGSAWITGVTQLVVDPSDPFPQGYLLTDTWPGLRRAELTCRASRPSGLCAPRRSHVHEVGEECQARAEEDEAGPGGRVLAPVAVRVQEDGRARDGAKDERSQELGVRRVAHAPQPSPPRLTGNERGWSDAPSFLSRPPEVT